MSKLIAVWGTPDSGKTTFATKLARSIYEEYQSTVIVVYADNETPTLPVIFPNYKKEDMINGLEDKDTYQLYRDYLDNFRINSVRR